MRFNPATEDPRRPHDVEALRLQEDPPRLAHPTVTQSLNLAQALALAESLGLRIVGVTNDPALTQAISEGWLTPVSTTRDV